MHRTVAGSRPIGQGRVDGRDAHSPFGACRSQFDRNRRPAFGILRGRPARNPVARCRAADRTVRGFEGRPHRQGTSVLPPGARITAARPATMSRAAPG
jgi:hypothetical protein